MKELMDAMAARSGCTRSQFIRKLLAGELERVGLIELENTDYEAIREDDASYEVKPST